MAFLHCHGCGWSQDDFWSKEGYTPLTSDYVNWLKGCLFEDKIESDPVTGSGTISGTELVVQKLEEMAKVIRNMNVKTEEEWKKVKGHWRCPECGSLSWDID